MNANIIKKKLRILLSYTIFGAICILYIIIYCNLDVTRLIIKKGYTNQYITINHNALINGLSSEHISKISTNFTIINNINCTTFHDFLWTFIAPYYDE